MLQGGYDPLTHRARSAQAWGSARDQQGVVSRRQLEAIGFSGEAIKHRLRTGRLRRRRLPHAPQRGALYGICIERPGRIEVGVPFAHPVGPEELRVRRFEVDFFWPDLKLVIETDGLKNHRTPAEQARDAKRDQAHTAAGFTRLRFPHYQVRYEPEDVKRILRATLPH